VCAEFNRLFFRFFDEPRRPFPKHLAGQTYVFHLVGIYPTCLTQVSVDIDQSISAEGKSRILDEIE
jgi:hypothetical protein